MAQHTIVTAIGKTLNHMVRAMNRIEKSQESRGRRDYDNTLMSVEGSASISINSPLIYEQ
jgi:hypothetical protein